MEYIPDAQPITDHADAARLDMRDRLRLFLQVCDAVHHGHQKGVIHRDLKPGNILVTQDASEAAPRKSPGDGRADRSAGDRREADGAQVKVIDFGIARSTDADVAATTLRTETGQLIGTLQYMSPEQCAADPHQLDVCCDVYALGVVLYELICGRLPYDVRGQTLHTAARIICEAPPDPPGATDRRLRGDLETILLKALEKDRERRYQSARDLADDIRHYLRGEPIKARLPTPWSRGVHWVARHPIVTSSIASVSIAGLVLALTALSVWWWNQRPFQLRVVEPRRHIEIRSRSGASLFEWRSAGGYLWAYDMTDPIDALGGRRFFFLGTRSEYEHDYPGEIVVYAPDADLDRPLWRDAVKPGDLPDRVKKLKRSADIYRVDRAQALDVFEQVPGPELVVVFGCHFSQRAFRIYNLQTGERLFQFWQDGGIHSVYYANEANLLICSGLYNNVKWQAKHRAQFGQEGYPIIVFAVKPRLGVLMKTFIDDARPDEDPIWPAWYYCMLVAGGYDRALNDLKSTVETPIMNGADPTPVVDFGIPIGVHWPIDAQGTVLPKRALDHFTRSVPDGVTLDDFTLEPLPDLPPFAPPDPRDSAAAMWHWHRQRVPMETDFRNCFRASLWHRRLAGEFAGAGTHATRFETAL